MAKARFKFGDIIENGWAGDGNPRKRGVFLWTFNRPGRLNAGKHVKLLHNDGKCGELSIADDDKLSVVGTIFDAHEAEIVALQERVRRLEEALKPFDAMAKHLFTSNWDASNVVLETYKVGGQTAARLTAGDFFAVRVALGKEG